MLFQGFVVDHLQLDFAGHLIRCVGVGNRFALGKFVKPLFDQFAKTVLDSLTLPENLSDGIEKTDLRGVGLRFFGKVQKHRLHLFEQLVQLGW